MTTRQGRGAHQVHIVVDSLASDFSRGLEKWPQIDVKTQVGESRGDHLGPPVVTVLTHLGHQNTRPATHPTRERGGGLQAALDLR
jgi:hypothetical protein